MTGDAISGAELRVWLDWLGLSEGQFARLAEQFDHPVDANEVNRWSSGAVRQVDLRHGFGGG